MGLRKFLTNNDANCKCGLTTHQHGKELNSCSAKDVRHILKKAERSVACGCKKYRPSLLGLLEIYVGIAKLTDVEKSPKLQNFMVALTVERVDKLTEGEKMSIQKEGMN